MHTALFTAAYGVLLTSGVLHFAVWLIVVLGLLLGAAATA
jgi:hypothetical protein